MNVLVGSRPQAKMQRLITVDDVLESRTISDPLHLLDCCIISDGGGAVIVTSAERARDLAKPPVILRGCGEAVWHQELGAPDLLTIAANASGKRAFEMAGRDRSRSAGKAAKSGVAASLGAGASPISSLRIHHHFSEERCPASVNTD